jgi:hypothetical protein
MSLLKVSTEQKNNKEFVLTHVNASGRNLEYASDALKNDKEVVLAAVKNSSSSSNTQVNNFKMTRKL